MRTPIVIALSIIIPLIIILPACTTSINDEAHREAALLLNSFCPHCDEYYYQEFENNIYQIKGEFTCQVIPKLLDQAQKMNGIEWQGDASFRLAPKSVFRIYTKTNNQWSEWLDAVTSYDLGMMFSMEKKNGKWDTRLESPGGLWETCCSHINGSITSSNPPQKSHQSNVLRSTINFTGTYQSRNDILEVLHTPDKFEFRIQTTWSGSASDQVNTGEICGTTTIVNNMVTFKNEDLDCLMSMQFDKSGTVKLSQNGSCGFGVNVDASGIYKLTSSSRPKMEPCE